MIRMIVAGVRESGAEECMGQRTAYGGQAVIEGVMIRGKERVATAVRLKEGAITVRRDAVEMLTQRHRWLGLAFLRGTPALIDSLRLGYRTLMWSADQAMDAEATPQAKPNAFQYALTVVVAMAFAIGVFGMLPTWLVSHVFPWAKHLGNPNADLLTQLIPSSAAILPNIVEGLIRVLMLVAYIAAIGRSQEIRRVFAYHGAEHKVVNAWEAGVAELTVETTRPFSRIHPRCGTSFLFLVFVVGILVHALIGWPQNLAIRMASRLIMLPLVAGAAYELIRLAGRFRNALMLQLLVWPGLLLQRLTTAEPADDQVEVAIQAMRAVLEDEGVLAPATPAPVEAPVPGNAVA